MDLLTFVRQSLAEDSALGAAELHAKMRIIRAWPDPFGNWTAEQAEAARAMKEAVLRAMASVYEEHPDYRPDLPWTAASQTEKDR
ncbi:DUF6221 family protein [Actinacidiphila sp. ITFR-21]|uniref:DUF6221 family protein n=1 Tax=Actinacidiphila sp. ITFR-21 TaxID=3075199 RepID=UPI002889D24D|nr:DUF6221 family protein [Streptomyces sp. ITFR-21]WNI19232.1 DUF6221 family protein [Streptomyces sp. ITFR-21]